VSELDKQRNSNSNRDRTSNSGSKIRTRVVKKTKSSVNVKSNRERELETKVGIGKRKTENGTWERKSYLPTKKAEGLTDSVELVRRGGIVKSGIGNGMLENRRGG
jgi:hypothetical protein